MSYDIVQEDVPPFTKRVGDRTIQGSNNTIIILGTDRAKKGPAKLSDGLGHVDADGKGKGTGTVHIIAGRQDEEGNPDLDKDLAYIYLSMKTEVDKNVGTSMEADAGKVPAAVLKADSVRIVVRKDLKIAVDGSKSYLWLKKEEMVLKTEQGFVKLKGDKITVDAGTIELGEGAKENVILGKSFKTYFTGHTHPSAAGPTGPPIQPWVDATLLSQRKVLAK